MAAKIDTLPLACPGDPATLTVERHRLDNGLAVLLVVDRSAPVIAYQTWLGVGSRHEVPGKTGIAHLFEHLMFNETEGLAYGEFDRRLEQAGAESNAATFLDWTFYTVSLPRDALQLVMAMEAERLDKLVLREAQLESERQVVMNERRQTVDDDVDGAVSEQLYLTAFERHGYRWPTIGSMDDIAGLDLEDCHRFYRDYYQPNNVTLVVVGDFDVDAVLGEIDKRYGKLEATAVPSEVDRAEPPQTLERRVRLEKAVTGERVVMGYKSPALADGQHAPLVLLNEVLFGGRASRGHRALVEQSALCSEAVGFVGSFRDPSLYEVHLTAQGGTSCEAMINALDDEIARVVADGVTPQELGRVQARLELSTLQGLESAAAKAEQVGFFASVLDAPTGLFDKLARYRSCTPDDVHAAARRCLTAPKRTVVEVRPLTAAGGGSC